jgi:hypothetical protein
LTHAYTCTHTHTCRRRRGHGRCFIESSVLLLPSRSGYVYGAPSPVTHLPPPFAPPQTLFLITRAQARLLCLLEHPQCEAGGTHRRSNSTDSAFTPPIEPLAGLTGEEPQLNEVLSDLDAAIAEMEGISVSAKAEAGPGCGAGGLMVRGLRAFVRLVQGHGMGECVEWARSYADCLTARVGILRFPLGCVHLCIRACLVSRPCARLRAGSALVRTSWCDPCPRLSPPCAHPTPAGGTSRTWQGWCWRRRATWRRTSPSAGGTAASAPRPCRAPSSSPAAATRSASESSTRRTTHC